MSNTTIFNLSNDRIASIARIADVTEEEATNVAIGTDWSEGEGHQRWLDETSNEEIASWVKGIVADLRAEARNEEIGL